MDIYQRLKVKTYINAWDAVSAYGSSRMEPETLAAMRDAASKYVPIRDLQQAVGRKIAQMTGNEAAYVVSGTAAGMLLASAVCMVRHPEPELFAMLPNAQELRNEFILLRERKTSVGYAIKAAGGKVIDVGFGKHVTTADIERAITPRTCAIVYCDTQVLSMKCPPLRTLTLLAHKHDLYMVVRPAPAQGESLALHRGQRRGPGHLRRRQGDPRRAAERHPRRAARAGGPHGDGHAAEDRPCLHGEPGPRGDHQRLHGADALSAARADGGAPAPDARHARADRRGAGQDHAL